MTEASLTLSPSARHEVIDLRARMAGEIGDLLRRHRKALYCSLHTTAGFLDNALVARLRDQGNGLRHFFGAFRTLFPPDAPYQHDRLELRSELSQAQRQVEPRNGDSHLTFIGSGLRNCVTRFNRAQTPVYFVELDGVNGGQRRTRSTVVVGYDTERVVQTAMLEIPVSRHPVDSINLADPRSGLVDEIGQLLGRAGVGRARVDIALDPVEGNAGLTVNEYETLLMRHDLAEVLRNPLKFAALKSRHMIEDPRAIPGKTVNYAKYDLVHVFNSLMEAFAIDESVVERLLSRLIALPARRFLRMKRRVSFLACGDGEVPGLVRGRYQSPILVQWRAAQDGVRRLQVTLVELS